VINLNIEFENPTAQDRPWIEALYRKSQCRGSECSFTNLFLWGKGYGQIAKIGDYMVQFLKVNGQKYYAFPAGSPDGDLKFVIDCLIEDAKIHGHDMLMNSITCTRKELLKKLYPDEFEFTLHRNAFDYLYEVDKLADLKGRKMQSKRNHCNRFEANYQDWHTVPLTEENMDICRQMADVWFAQHDGEESDEHDFRIEKIALTRAFDNFTLLGMEGLILYAENKLAAFTMGNPIQEDTYDVNFEKAFSEIQGAYPIINREFARYIRDKYPNVVYLNREDDMGLPGLRMAKESYRPDILLEKSTAKHVRNS